MSAIYPILIAWFGMGVLLFFANLLRSYAAARAGEALTLRLRLRVFDGILHQPLSWFRKPAHSLAIVTLRLSDDCAQVQNLLGERFSVLLLASATLISGLGVSTNSKANESRLQEFVFLYFRL